MNVVEQPSLRNSGWSYISNPPVQGKPSVSSIFGRLQEHCIAQKASSQTNIGPVGLLIRSSGGNLGGQAPDVFTSSHISTRPLSIRAEYNLIKFCEIKRPASVREGVGLTSHSGNTDRLYSCLYNRTVKWSQLQRSRMLLGCTECKDSHWG